MADNDVLIKIAADVASAVKALEGMVEKLDATNKAIAAIGDTSSKAKKDSESLSTFFGVQMAKSFDAAKEAALGLVEKIPDMVGHVAELGDSLLAMSQRTGVSVEGLSGLRFVASQAGVSFELLGRTVQQMGKEIGEGGTNTVNAIEGLGLSFEALKAQSPEQQFLAIMDKLHGITDASERTRKGVELLGPKFKMMSNLATEDIGKLMEEAKKLGLVMSEDTARAADRYGDSLDRINKMMEATRNEIGASLLGPLSDFLDLAPQVSGALLVIGDAVLDVGKAAGKVFINMLPQIVDKLGGWKKASELVKTETIALVTKLWTQVAATTALSAVQTEATVATKAWAVIQGIAAVATAGVTAAVRALTAAMLANPVLAIIAGLIALGAALWALKSHYKGVEEEAAKSAKTQMDAGKSVVQIEAELIQKEKEYQAALTRGEVVLAARLDSEIKGVKSSEDYKKAIEDYNTAIEAGLAPGANQAQVTAFLAEKQAEATLELHKGADAQAEIIKQSEHFRDAQDEGAKALEGFSYETQEQIKWLLLDADATNAVVAGITGMTEAQVQSVRTLMAARAEAAAFDAKIAAQRESMGLTGTSAALANAKAEHDAAIQAINDNKAWKDDAARNEAIRQADVTAQVKRAEILTNSARTAAQSRIQLAADAEIAAVNASKKGLDAQLAIIEIRRNAEIAAANASGDAVGAAIKKQEANAKAQQQSEAAIREERKKSAEDDLRQQAAQQQALIAIRLEGNEKEMALIKAKEDEDERIARDTITDATSLADKLTLIHTDAANQRVLVTEKAAKQEREAAAEAVRQQNEYEIKTTKVGIDQIAALREIELERRLEQARKSGEDEQQVRLRFEAETARLIAEGDDVTYTGRQKKATAARNAYIKANNDQNVSDKERLRLLLAALEAEAQARGVVARKTSEYHAAEILAAAVALDNIKKQTDATYEQVEAAQDLLDLKLQEAQVDEEARRKLAIAQSQAKEARMRAHGATPKEIADERGRRVGVRGYQTKEEATQAVADAEQALKDLGKDASKASRDAAEKTVKDAKEAAGQTVTTWGEATSSIAASFEQMANIGGKSFGGISKAVGGVFSQMDFASKNLGGLFGKDAVTGKDKTLFGLPGMDSIGGGKLAKGMGAAAQVAGGVQAFMAGTDKRGAGQRALGGAMAGAQIGSIAGPWGTAIGAGVGAIVGALRKPGWVKAAKDVGRDFGTEITDELAKEVEKSAKEKFKGDRGAGALFNLDAIIGEAGGLKSGNIDKFTGKLRDVFSMVETGKFSAEQGRETLEKNFGAFADYIIKSNKVASKSFQELLTLNANSAAKSEEIVGFVSSQNQRLAAGLSGLFAPLSKQIGDMTDARKALSDAQASGKEIDADSRMVLQQMAGDIKGAGEQMQRFERLTLAGFNAAVAAGVPYLDALDQMGPALDQLSDANTKLGREGGAAINELLGIRELAKTYPELVASASSLNEVTMAMSNIGALNVDTMADLQAQGEETFGKLVEAGFTETQALQQMKGYLENVRQAHKDLGLPIDENTQLLINQAEQTGVLKKESMSTNEVMMEGFSAIIKALGGDIPAAFTKFKDAAAVAAQATTKSVDHVEAAINGVDSALSDTDWSGWSQEAVDAATDAQAAVDAVSFGSSPGGIKEIPLKLAQSMQAFRDWQKVSVGAAGAVRDAIDASIGSTDGIAYAGQMSGDAAIAAAAEAKAQQDMISLNVAISTIDTQGMEEAVEKKMLPAISKILRKGGRNLSDIQGVLR